MDRGHKEPPDLTGDIYDTPCPACHELDCLHARPDEVERTDSRPVDGMTVVGYVQRSIEPIEKAYDDACGDYEAEWYLAYEKGERKWPGADVRRVIARRHIDVELRDRFDRLAESRERIRDRIDNVSKTVTAYQSILRALREEMGATR